jgi:phospholipid:diacylglycerol acyltransferase
MLSFSQDIAPPVDGNMTWEESWNKLILPRLGGREFTSGALGSSSVAANIKDLSTNKDFDKYKYWTNPLASALPYAPNMKIWCMYGTNQSAERGYLYRTSPYSQAGPESPQETTTNFTSVPYTIFNSVNGEDFVQGVRLTNGDGTVPLLSLGYMCNEGWTNPKYPYNPGKINVTTIEYPHEPAGFSLRGGGKSSDHIDILGNTEMLEAIVCIAAGQGDLVEGRLLTNIKDIASSIDLISLSSSKAS